MLGFSVSSDVWWRLPRHPDWKYEMVKGEAWLSSRPRPLRLRRSTSLEVPAVTLSGVEVRTIDARRDRSVIAKLLMDVWIEEDPYRSLEDPETLLQAEIERSLNEPSLGGEHREPALALDPRLPAGARPAQGRHAPPIPLAAGVNDHRHRQCAAG